MISNSSFQLNTRKNSEALTCSVSSIQRSSMRLNTILFNNDKCVENKKVLNTHKPIICISQEPLSTGFAKTELMSECFLDDISTRMSSNSQVTSSDFGLSNGNEEDTDSFGISSDSEENELANELKSRSEADDELASLFADNEPIQSERVPSFARPCNPIVRDRKFTMARCHAPSLEAQPMTCFSSFKSTNYTLGQRVS